MNRIFIRTFGYCISIFGTFIGRSANAIIDNSVYLQCEYSVSGYYFAPEVLETSGGLFSWAACDNGGSYSVVAAGPAIAQNNYFFADCMREGNFNLNIITTGINGDKVVCYCNSTGIACPYGSGWLDFLTQLGCTEGYASTGMGDCYYYGQDRGLYLVLNECPTGFAHPDDGGVVPKYYPVTGEYLDQDPSGYCYRCSGLGHNGNNFYTYTPANGVTSSGSIYWETNSNWSEVTGLDGVNGSIIPVGCRAYLNGSITDSKGTFVLDGACADAE